jgi:hypothetical protein
VVTRAQTRIAQYGEDWADIVSAEVDDKGSFEAQPALPAYYFEVTSTLHDFGRLVGRLICCAPV